MRSIFAALAASVTVGLLVSGCDSSICGDSGTCPPATPGGDAGADVTVDGVAPDGGDADGNVPSKCDATKSTKTDPCVLDEVNAVFVDATKGLDANAGTKAAPKKTIGAALTAAKGASKAHVVACDGAPFDEKLVLEDAVSLHGGVSCDAWTTSTKRTVVKPSTTGIVVTVKGAGTLVLEDLELEAKDGAAPGESSIAVFVQSSAAGVTLRRSRLIAGAGAKGADGTAGKADTSSCGSLEGKPATGTTAGDPLTCSCPLTGGTTKGAKGGSVGAAGERGEVAPAGAGGEGGVANTNCGAGGLGVTGANGAEGQDKPAAASLGVLDKSGWAPSSGAPGGAGAAGQGGGGGGGRGGAGGGGGAGSCGSTGGGGGGGGGASVALLVLESSVTLEASELVTAKAGDGGKGAVGGGEGLGGGGGGLAGAGTPNGCGGGEGGKGGRGGAGSGGAGGVSVAVLYRSSVAPVLDKATSDKVTSGAPGAGGAGGKPGVNDGKAGKGGGVEDAAKL